MKNTELKYIFQENGVSSAFTRTHGQRLSDNFLLRVWVINPNNEGNLTLQISEPDTEEWVDVVDSSGTPITFSTSMSTLFQTGSDCSLRWKLEGLPAIANPIDPLDLDEEVRYDLDQYPSGSIKVGIRFR